jgi:hypothetical protein
MAHWHDEEQRFQRLFAHLRQARLDGVRLRERTLNAIQRVEDDPRLVAPATDELAAGLLRHIVNIAVALLLSGPGTGPKDEP